MTSQVRKRIGCITVLGLLFFVHPLPALLAQPRSDAEAELQSFNKAMRSIYADSRAQLLAATRPIIVVGSQELTLLTSTGRDDKRYTPRVFHQLKTFSHVVLGVIGAVTPWPDAAKDGARWRKAFATIDKGSAALLQQLDAMDLEPSVKARQRRILNATLRLTSQARESGRPDRGSFRTYLEQIKPDWLANATDAARAQLESMHEVVSQWRERMPANDWSQLKVIVLGPRMPQVGNLQTAHFARLLGADVSGVRLIYAENIFNAEGGLKLMGVIVMDRHLSSLVFGDPFRMDRDLLGYAAGAILDELLPGEGKQ